MSMNMLRVHVHAACPCCMPTSMLLFSCSISPECQSFNSHLMSILNIDAACLRMSMPKVYAACPNSCPWCLSMLLIHYAWQFCEPILHVCGASPCYMSIEQSCCLSIEHVHSPCPCLHAACPRGMQQCNFQRKFDANLSRTMNSALFNFSFDASSCIYQKVEITPNVGVY